MHKMAASGTEAEDVLQDGDIVQAVYKSRDVPIPDDFLNTDPSDARPIVANDIDWLKTDLPENEGRYATVLDNVLSPSECDTLLRMAEDSVDDRGKSGNRTWAPALVNIGGGWEALKKGYRDSDRIVWDNQAVMDRLWARCARVDGLLERLATVQEPPSQRMRMRGSKGNTWEFERLNERMRFLKYGAGQFFRRKSAHSSSYSQQTPNPPFLTAHCDGAFSQEVDGKVLRTFYTLHLYLNDAEAEAEIQPSSSDATSQTPSLVGGATSFLSYDHDVRRVDVNPKAGRVLIFQHDGLYHSGDDVVQGVKYTMRTDALFRLVKE